MANAQTIMGYLKRELSTGAGFVREFMALSKEEQTELKAYAVAEMKVLNIEVKK